MIGPRRVAQRDPVRSVYSTVFLPNEGDRTSAAPGQKRSPVDRDGIHQIADIARGGLGVRDFGVHATLAGWFKCVVDAGFPVQAIREPAPTAAAVQANPDLEDAGRIPYYLMST